MRYRVIVEGLFDSKEAADEAFNAMEDAVSRYNGELINSVVEYEEEDE